LGTKRCCLFPEINDKFEKHSVFKTSLIRYDEQEQLLREAKYRVYDYNLSNLYSFKYNYLPKFSKTALDIEFNFDNNEDFPNRKLTAHCLLGFTDFEVQRRY
jgi:hypothetical protein